MEEDEETVIQVDMYTCKCREIDMEGWGKDRRHQKDGPPEICSPLLRFRG